MPDEYRLTLHPDLAEQYHALEKAAEDAGGLAARRFAMVQDAVTALRDGREAEFEGERLSFSGQHSDLRDCAEIKVPIIREFNRRGQPMGPSHRIVYREFDSPDEDPRPVRQLLVYEPRRGGRPFAVAARRLGRSIGRSVEALNQLPAIEPGVGPAKASGPAGPVRQPAPPDLAAAIRAASNPSSAYLATYPPRTPPEASRASPKPTAAREHSK